MDTLGRRPSRQARKAGRSKRRVMDTLVSSALRMETAQETKSMCFLPTGSPADLRWLRVANFPKHSETL